MRISYRLLYFLPLFLVFFTDNLFINAILGDSGSSIRGPDVVFGEFLDKLVPVTAFAGSLFFARELNGFMRFWYIMFLVCFFAMILESYIFYGSIIKYPHVFSKLFQLSIVFAIYGFYRVYLHKININTVSLYIIIFFIINLALVNSHALSLSSFADHERGVSAHSTFFLVLPSIYFFNNYFYKKKIINIYLFFFTCLLIIFLQHRTIWISLIVALTINLLLLPKTGIKISIEALLPIFVLIGIASFLGSIYVLSNEVIINKLSESVEDILNPINQGTGNWRYLQFESYLPYIQENWSFGMRLEGFELPVQFYDHTNNLAFEDGTGHHFHSMYTDKLFYFGVTGILLFLIPPVIYSVKRIILVKKLTLDQIAAICFASPLLIFGLSYDFEVNTYAIIGLALCYIEQAYQNEKSSKNAHPEEGVSSKPLEKSEILIANRVT